MQEVTISLDRFQQLLRAEQDANHLKALIADKFESYGSLDREDLKLLCILYCGYSGYNGAVE